MTNKTMTHNSDAETHDMVQSPQQRVSLFRRLLLPVLITLSGLSLLLYPVVATQINNFEQRRASLAFEESKKQIAPEKLNEELISAREYNKNRTTGPILDPWLARVTDDNVEYQEYLKQLSALPAMGRVIVPSVKIDLPILHGTTPDVLERGVGHLYGSDLPIGGEKNHAVLTGHTGLPTATLFDELVDVKKGDDIFVVSLGEQMRYVVDDIQTVLPDQADVLYQVKDQDRITLITCTPYGINSHRLLVMAHREPLDEQNHVALSETVELLWPMWMLGILVAVGIVLVGLFAWIIAMVRRERKMRDSDVL